MLTSLAAMAMSGCQILADLEVKALAIEDASPTRHSDAGTERTPTDADAGGDVVLPAPPKPGCTEGRPGATTDCGISGAQNCCDVSIVEAGKFFLRTGTIDDTGPDDTSRPTELSAFAMDTFEVTVGRFRAFVESGGALQTSAPTLGAGAHPSNAESGWRESFVAYLARDRAELEGQLARSKFSTWSPKPEGHEQHPISGVSWFHAMTFCIWDGARLPTDAEWAYAAAGGAEQRPYPWGHDLVEDGAVWQCGDRYGTPYSWDSCSSQELATVGSRPKGRGRWGHEDLLGNVDEWLLDIFCVARAHAPCKDCVATGSCFFRTSRGGDLRMLMTENATTYSRWRQASEPSSAKGFRCVRPL